MSSTDPLDGLTPGALLELGLEERRPLLAPGSSLGRYRILSLLGRGGMGDVYAAEDPRLGRRVALKLLREDTCGDASRRARLEREARALAALNHTSIVTLYSLEEDDAARFLTMELVEGETLESLLTAGPMPIPKILEVGRALASALAAAHEHQVLHRDLKPSNVLITPDGKIKVLDFGLARLLATADAEGDRRGHDPSDGGAIAGTAPYMSPEQVRGLELDARSDLFSLGAVLYELVTGAPAFPGSTRLEVFESVLRQAPAPPRRLRPELPESLEMVILRCLRKDPAQRPRDAAEVHDRLVRIEESLLPRGREVRFSPSGTVRPRRAPAARRAAAGALLAAALGLVYLGLRIDRSLRAPPAGALTVAVAPFEDLSGREGEEYLVAGITESLITRLGQSPGLRVLAPHPGARRLTPSQLARRFGVTAVVAGALSRPAGRVHLTVRLVSPESGELLWAQSYERPASDALSLQREATGAVAREIRARLLDEETEEAEAVEVNPEAYEHYLKGRYLWNRRNVRSLSLAAEELNEAIRLDPGYAPAHAALANCYNLMGSGEYSLLPPREAAWRARESARRALELDPDLADAHVSLGHVYLFFDWDAQRAEEAFRRAIELDGRNATAHEWYSILLSLTGRAAEALAEAERARELDPLSPILYVWLGNRSFYAGAHEEAIAPLLEAIDLDPNVTPAHLFLARTYQALGRTAEAEEAYQRALEVSGASPAVVGLYGHFLAETGQRGAARRQLARLGERARRGYVPPFAFGVIHLGLGEQRQALEALERSVEERSSVVFYLGIEPVTRPLRGDPRFRELLAGLHLGPQTRDSAASAPAPAR